MHSTRLTASPLPAGAGRNLPSLNCSSPPPAEPAHTVPSASSASELTCAFDWFGGIRYRCQCPPSPPSTKSSPAPTHIRPLRSHKRQCVSLKSSSASEPADGTNVSRSSLKTPPFFAATHNCPCGSFIRALMRPLNDSATANRRSCPFSQQASPASVPAQTRPSASSAKVRIALLGNPSRVVKVVRWLFCQQLKPLAAPPIQSAPRLSSSRELTGPHFTPSWLPKGTKRKPSK